MSRARVPIIAGLVVILTHPAVAMGAGSDSRPIAADTIAQSETNGIAAQQALSQDDTSRRRWGVQLAASFSKEQALASFDKARVRHPDVIGSLRPVIIDTSYGSRGPAPPYRVRLPAASQAEATWLCDRIRSAGGNCVVLATP